MHSSFFIFSISVWLLCVLFRLFVAQRPWTFLETVQHDVRFICHSILYLVEMFVTNVYVMCIVLSVFFDNEGFVAIIVVMGILHYSAPWELVNPYVAPGIQRMTGYFFGPGRDELFIGNLLENWASNPKTLVILLMGVIGLLLPKQSLTRDRIMRRLYEGGFFPTYRECFLFVKRVSWAFIIACILYISYV